MPKIQIANPLPGSRKYTTISQAERFVRRGEAVLIGNTLHILTPEEIRQQRHIECCIQSERSRSDVYVDKRGTIFWNGARANYVNGRDIAMFPPGCNVVFPKVGTASAARRYAT